MNQNDLAKQKAAAAAKAKAAAQAKRKPKKAGTGNIRRMQKAICAKQKQQQPQRPKPTESTKILESIYRSKEEAVPSANQPYLDRYIKVIEEHLGKNVIEDYYINTLSKDVPTIVVKKEAYYIVAEFLKYNEQLAFDYLSELHGSDFETHMEVYTHLYSYQKASISCF